MTTGKLIVIEGTDGSGKATQTKLLLERLKSDGHKVFTFSFPQYHRKSSRLIVEYLNGKYGPPDDFNPYAASLLFAFDRVDASNRIRAALADGHTVVLDRYVDSNIGHQGGKISDSQKLSEFARWVYHVEFDVLEVPKPDLIIFLHVPAEIGQQLVSKKDERSYVENGSADGHEANLVHLKNAENTYLWLSASYSENHITLECMENGNLLPPETIHEKVYEILKTKR